MTIPFFNLREKKSIQDDEHTYRVFNYINVPMDVKEKTLGLYLFSTIAVLKHMSLNENKVQFRKKASLCHSQKHPDICPSKQLKS